MPHETIIQVEDDLLHRLFYISNANSDVSHRELSALLPRARRNNDLHQISGVLFYDGMHFCQVIEGRSSDLLQLLSNISKDERHSRMNVLFFEPIKERRFKGWALGYSYDEGIRTLIADTLTGHEITHYLAKNLLEQLLHDADQLI